jgi:amino acid transporter
MQCWIRHGQEVCLARHVTTHHPNNKVCAHTSRLLARVNRNTRSPVTATWVMTFATFLLGLPMLGSTVAFTAVTSLATIGLNLSE